MKVKFNKETHVSELRYISRFENQDFKVWSKTSEKYLVFMLLNLMQVDYCEQSDYLKIDSSIVLFLQQFRAKMHWLRQLKQADGFADYHRCFLVIDREYLAGGINDDECDEFANFVGKKIREGVL